MQDGGRKAYDLTDQTYVFLGIKARNLGKWIFMWAMLGKVGLKVLGWTNSGYGAVMYMLDLISNLIHHVLFLAC